MFRTAQKQTLTPPCHPTTRPEHHHSTFPFHLKTSYLALAPRHQKLDQRPTLRVCRFSHKQRHEHPLVTRRHCHVHQTHFSQISKSIETSHSTSESQRVRIDWARGLLKTATLRCSIMCRSPAVQCARRHGGSLGCGELRMAVNA